MTGGRDSRRASLYCLERKFAVSAVIPSCGPPVLPRGASRRALPRHPMTGYFTQWPVVFARETHSLHGSTATLHAEHA